MARYDFRSPRLFMDAPVGPGARLTLDHAQANYLCNVLRLAGGDPVLVFNGRDGEWRCELERGARRATALNVVEQVRAQTASGDLHYLFAPLKHARLDYMVQKAVELGVSRLQPVMTRHTQAARVNSERMRANAVEAAEQCGILSIPDIAPASALERALADLGTDRVLIFCDEDADMKDPVAALAPLRRAPPVPLAVLIGPEGGFAEEERALLVRRSQTVRLSLGPRILRADTAAVAALALVQAVCGDWR
ncbi:MAG: 16S rRNA (uracil(1498)-N(3))-methyltransferase [Pseudorhodoplanes sp.]|nr:16S rRNA (uracil(1498)-N(3))-methyltransferase [Pseudorhodoplanes sp.]MCQ3942436.1 16S rRNA (uracil(1498)-N(3))-methyltransferase [Alphaproteobacteria bacterium]